MRRNCQKTRSNECGGRVVRILASNSRGRGLDSGPESRLSSTGASHASSQPIQANTCIATSKLTVFFFYYIFPIHHYHHRPIQNVYDSYSW
jgi:hypothetical protein